MDKQQCQDYASEMMTEACDLFQEVNHPAGAILCQEAIYKLMHDEEKKEELEAYIKEMRSKYKSRLESPGNCYIERTLGEETSLLTEIVLNDDYASLFPEQSKKDEEESKQEG